MTTNPQLVSSKSIPDQVSFHAKFKFYLIITIFLIISFNF